MLIDHLVKLIYYLVIISWILFPIMQNIWKKQDHEFIRFLNNNREEIMNGGSCEFMGFTYTRETRVIRFSCCISVIILTLCRSSCIVPTDRSGATRLLCVLMTLLGGWWGFPWGPIRTVQTICDTARATEISLYDVYTRGVI
ncbi:MAG: hypothetical protein ACI4J0_04165 [Huintestinicola sp.]|uniref:hypothetical protein n=1 Tax=Huintestinicola sp. TaxID=2981661 RepID=UPI003F060E46